MSQVTASHQSVDRNNDLISESYVPKALPHILGTFDMTALYLVVVFFIVNATAAASAGPAGFTYLVIGAVVFFIPCAVATAQLGHIFPHEGSLYNWTHKALGGYWSFFIGFCAWFPGVLVMVAGADAVVSIIQSLNATWLVMPWQQGGVICGIIVLSGIIAVQRARLVQNIVNGAVILIGVVVVFLFLSIIIWLVTGHHSMTDFRDISSWGIHWQNPQTANIGLFGTMTLAYLGTEVPLNMGGEMRHKRAVTRHLFWGTLLVIVGYIIATAALLIERGTNVSALDLITAIDQTLGKFCGNIVSVGILCFFVVVPIVYNVTFARLLLVGALDNRLPHAAGRLNLARAPKKAIQFQTLIAIVFTILVFVIIPYLVTLGNASDLSVEVYNISQASVTLVWAISTAFLFINLWLFYFRDRKTFQANRIFPMSVLVICSLIGPVACLAAIIDTLFFSWIPKLIPNTNWWYIIGGVTITCLVIAAVGSSFARGEAAWESMDQVE